MKQNFGNRESLDIYSNYLYHKNKCFVLENINTALKECQLLNLNVNLPNLIHQGQIAVCESVFKLVYMTIRGLVCSLFSLYIVHV